MFTGRLHARTRLRIATVTILQFPGVDRERHRRHARLAQMRDEEQVPGDLMVEVRDIYGGSDTELECVVAREEVLSVVGIRRRDGGAGPCLAADTPSRDQARSALTADHPAWPPLILEERWRNERRPEHRCTRHLTAWKTVSGFRSSRRPARCGWRRCGCGPQPW